MQRIAFITRVKGGPDNRKTEQLLINVLSFTPYTTTLQYFLQTSPYEANMEEGIKDDYIIEFFSA